MPTVNGPITIKSGESLPSAITDVSPVKLPFTSAQPIEVEILPDFEFIGADGAPVELVQA